MRKIKNPAIEETVFHARAVDYKVSTAGREYYTLELVGEGGELDGLITFATIFPGLVNTVQGRRALISLHAELNRDD